MSSSPSPPRLLVGSDNWRVFRTESHGSMCMEWKSSIVEMKQCDQTNVQQRWYATSDSPTAEAPMNIISAYDGKCLTVDLENQATFAMVMAECGTGDATKQQFYYGLSNRIKHLYTSGNGANVPCVQYHTSTNTVRPMSCSYDQSQAPSKQRWQTETRPPAPPPPPLPPSPSGPAWTPLGTRLNGKLSNSHFGAAVALSNDGSILAVGAPRNDNQRGLVRVFARTDSSSSTTWTQRGDDLTGAAMNVRFGDSVALSADGTVLAVGASEYSHSGVSKAGGVWVYVWAGGSWTDRGEAIVSSTAQALFGAAVALSNDGTVVAAGGSWHDNSKGVARVYEWQSGSGSWQQRGADLNGGSQNDMFGSRVELSSDGSTLAVSAHQERNTAGSETAGCVRVYSWSVPSVAAAARAGSWVLKGSLISGDSRNDRLGSGLAMSGQGTVVAVGAPGDAGSMPGKAKVYEWANVGGAGLAWVQRGGTIDGASQGDQFGWSVALSSDGSRLAVGARSSDAGGTDSGTASLFTYASAAVPSDGSWSKMMADIMGMVRARASPCLRATRLPPVLLSSYSRPASFPSRLTPCLSLVRYCLNGGAASTTTRASSSAECRWQAAGSGRAGPAGWICPCRFDG